MGLEANISYDYVFDGGQLAGSKKTTTVYIDIREDGKEIDGQQYIVTVKIIPLNQDAYTENISIKSYHYPYKKYDTSLPATENSDIPQFSILQITPDTNPITVTGNITINSVTINNSESSPGAKDARITVNATSNYGSIQYSLDGTSFQTSASFTGLGSGGCSAYARDASGQTVSYYFTVPLVKSLLVSEPAVNVSNNNYSRWSAAFNPIVFTYQRRDFEVTGISDYGSPKGTLINVNGATDNIKVKDYVYLNAASYKNCYEVIGVLDNGVVINAPFVAATDISGYLNSNTLYSYYNVQTLITYTDKQTAQVKTVRSTNRPDNAGLIRADLSSFLQSLLFAKDDSNYTQSYYTDSNLSTSYTIAYQENWTDPVKGDISLNSVPVSTPYYITYTARQLGDKYGGNMAAYVPFRSVASPSQLAKWITDFTEPAYSIGYPFDLSFIYSEDLLGLDVYSELTLLDVNRNPIGNTSITSYMLNNNSSYLLNEDGSRFIIKKTDIGSLAGPIPQQVGLTRLLVNLDFPPEVYYFTLTLNYKDAQNTAHPVTQTQIVRIDDAVDENAVYLRWLGLTGSWNYYRFVFNQEVSLDVQDAVIIKNYVFDWENQESIEEVISKTAGQKIKVMAEDLSVADIKGLQSIKYSPKVQMLVNRNPVKWQTIVINSATFSEYETQYGQYAFSITFNLPSINIQTQ